MVEIYDEGTQGVPEVLGQSVLHGGQTRQLSTPWPTSGLTAGTYSVKVAVFGVGWNPFIHWNANAATVSSTRAQPPTTTRSRPRRAPRNHDDAAANPHGPHHDRSPSGRFATLPLGSALPTGAQCAALVRPAVEIRPENAAANNTRGSRANANTRSDWPSFNRVDGDFVGTTDQIIQWAACKWGIDEDIARAQVIKESYWYQSANGDGGESWGLGQVRDTAHQAAFQYRSTPANSSLRPTTRYTYASCALATRASTRGSTRRAQRHLRRWRRVGCLVHVVQRALVRQPDRLPNQTGDSVRWHYNNKTWDVDLLNG